MLHKAEVILQNFSIIALLHFRPHWVLFCGPVVRLPTPLGLGGRAERVVPPANNFIELHFNK